MPYVPFIRSGKKGILSTVNVVRRQNLIFTGSRARMMNSSWLMSDAATAIADAAYGLRFQRQRIVVVLVDVDCPGCTLSQVDLADFCGFALPYTSFLPILSSILYRG